MIRVILIGLACALLAACGGPKLSENQKAEVSDIASSEAFDAVGESPEVQDLQNRVEELERRLDDQGVD